MIQQPDWLRGLRERSASTGLVLLKAALEVIGHACVEIAVTAPKPRT